jgi:pimeloyl-ACP methyl ester carboxylesterase
VVYGHPVRLMRFVGCALLALTAVGCGGGSDSSFVAPVGSNDITIATSDGETLIATRAGAGPIGVVVVHGSNASRENWFDAGGQLAATGDFTVVMINLRGYKGSTGTARSHQDIDIFAAMDWLANEPGIASVSLIGSSMGATSVLDAAGQRAGQVRSVVALSPPRQSASMDAEAAVPHLTMPIMLLAAEGDKTFVESTTALAEQLGIAPMITKGSGHGTGMFADNPELVDAIASFLSS